jgi:hypothetical protein
MREVTRKRLLAEQGGQQKDLWALAAQILGNTWKEKRAERQRKAALGEPEVSGMPKVAQKEKQRKFALYNGDEDMGTPNQAATESNWLAGGSPGGSVETEKNILSLLETLTTKVDKVSKDLGNKVDAVSLEVREASGKIKRLEDFATWTRSTQEPTSI